jgi:uncharacterized protein (DUF2147 family)
MSRPGVEMANTGAPAFGLEVLSDFVPDCDNRWYGRIYDRENGKTYRCRMTLLDSGALEIRPYIGLSLFGQSQIWQRALGWLFSHFLKHSSKEKILANAA